MHELTQKAGLFRKESPSSLHGWALDSFSLHAFGDVVFSASKWSFVRTLQLIWRYGLWNLKLLRQYINQMLTDFAQIYSVLDAKGYALSVKDMLNTMTTSEKAPGENGYASRMLNDTKLSLKSRLRRLGVGNQLIDEMAMAAVHVNYGQAPHNVHATVGAVALAGARGGLWSIEGGNHRLAERLLDLSKASLVKARVNEVTSIANGYRVGFTRHSDVDEKRGPLREGENKPRAATMAQEVEKFDVVVLATPLTKDKSSIELKGLPTEPLFPGR